MKIIAIVLLSAIVIVACTVSIACVVVGSKLTPKEQAIEDALQMAEIRRKAKRRQQPKSF